MVTHISKEQVLCARLLAAGIPNAAQELRWISERYSDPATIADCVARRCQHEPLQYLLGEWDFCGLTFAVGAGVLIPRADTECLAEAVAAKLRDVSSPKLVDLCAGSGCLAITLAKWLPQATVAAVEWSDAALPYLNRNCEMHGVAVSVRQADVLSHETAAAFADLDAIVCNPPYLTADELAHLQAEVCSEPRMALDGGADGFHFYRQLPTLWRESLREGGLLALEVGHQQAETVCAMLAQANYTNLETIQDWCGIRRVVMGRKGRTNGKG